MPTHLMVARVFTNPAEPSVWRCACGRHVVSEHVTTAPGDVTCAVCRRTETYKRQVSNDG